MADGRVYGGRSEHERRTDRRVRLITAGLEVFGTEGWSGATIEKLCVEAGVATRSFYEEFTSREALLRAVYETVMVGAIDAILPRLAAASGSPEERIRVGLTCYVDYLTTDLRRARVAHQEVRAAGVLERDRHAMVVRFAELIASQTRLTKEGPAGRVLALALAGAVTEVLVDWVAQPDPRPATGPIVDALVGLYLAAVLPPTPRRDTPDTAQA